MQGYKLKAEKDWEDFNTLMNNLTAEFGRDDLFLSIAALEKLKELNADERRNRAESILAAANGVISAIDVKQIGRSASVRSKKGRGGQCRVNC